MEAWQATAQDEAGNVIFNPTVTVYESDGITLAAIFNEDGSPKPNPFVGGIEGFCQFWAGPGTYKIRGVSGGQTDLWENDLGLAKEALETTRLYFNSIAELQSDTSLGYSAGHVVSIDDLVSIRDDGTIFRVLGAGDTRPHIETSGGVKLAVVRWGGDDRGALAQIGSRSQFGEAVRIACYGDSSVANNQVVESFNPWPQRLGSILRSVTGNADVLTYNNGTGGQKVIDWWAFDNYQTNVVGANSEAQYVFVCFGLNDVRIIDNNPAWNPDLYKERYAYHLNQIRVSGRIPVLVTPWLISAAPVRPNPIVQGDLLNAVRELAEEQRVALIDTNDFLQAWQRDRTDQFRIGDAQPDGTHYLDDANILIAQYMVREIFKDRIVDVSHGSKLGPQNVSYSSDVALSYNYLANNAFGYTAILDAAGAVANACEVFVWSDRARKAVYVSPNKSVVSGGSQAMAYVDKLGTPAGEGGGNATVNFGNSGNDTDNVPCENHLYVSDLPFGLSRLRFRCAGAGVYEFGSWLVVDRFDPVSVAAYSTHSTDRQLFLPDFADSRPEVVPSFPVWTNLAVIGDIPVGWGVVIGTQYVYDDTADYGPTRRKQSIVALRTSTGAQIRRVLSGASGVFAATDITTSGSGAWAGLITIHCTTDGGGNAQILVRANGQVIANHTNSGSDPLMSPYGRLGGLYRDPALVTDPDGRVACATVVPMPY